MPSIWDFPRREEQRGSAMGEPRARMLQVLGLLGTPFPTSGELGTSAMYRAGKLDAMAGGPTQGQFREGVSDKTKDLALNLFGIFKGVKGSTKAEKQVADVSMADLAAQLEAMRAANKAKGLPIETGTGDLRGEIARRNAVGLLGLPEGNTAADRASAMGVDTPGWHSTKKDFPEFMSRPPASSRRGSDFGVHVGTTTETANEAIIPSWYEKHGRETAARTDIPQSLRDEALRDVDAYYDESRVLPLMVAPGKQLEVPDFGRWDAPTNAISNIGKENWGTPHYLVKPTAATNDPAALQSLLNAADEAQSAPWDVQREQWTKAIENVLKERGYDSIAYQNTIEGAGSKSLMFVDPSRIRSRFAAFDPARRDEADLLAGLLPYAIPASLLGLLTLPREEYQ